MGDIPLGAESVRNPKTITNIPICDLDDALSRLSAYVDAVDWLLCEPERNIDLISELMLEIHRVLREAGKARDALLEEGRGR